MENEFDYYMLMNNGNPNIPMLKRQSKERYLYFRKKVETPELMVFDFAHPIPRKPELADFLNTGRTVFSQKILDALKPLNIKSVQFLPAEVEDTLGERFKGYYGLNVLKEIECLDRELSICDFKSYGLANIKKLVLDKKILREIPLNERLIFVLDEKRNDLFHASVVAAIEKANPSGLKFVKFEEFHSNIFFE